MPMLRFAAMAAALLALGLAALNAPATAQQPPDKAKEQAAPPAAKAKRPQIETIKVDGTDNVYIFRNGNAQSMFIVTKQGVIATDPIAYGRPTGGQDYVNEIRKITQAPIRYLIYSHGHFDHAAGGKAFKDAGATIVAHRNAKKRIAEINDPYTPVPDRAVGDRATIRLGGTTLELRYLGRSHSDSLLVMRLPREKLLFLVDAAPVGSLSGRGMIDTYPLEFQAFLKRVLALDWDRFIPGHPGQPDGRFGTRKDVEFTMTFLQDASNAVQTAAREGKCWNQAEKEVTLPKYESLSSYKTAMPFVITRYCALWGRGS